MRQKTLSGNLRVSEWFAPGAFTKQKTFLLLFPQHLLCQVLGFYFRIRISALPRLRHASQLVSVSTYIFLSTYDLFDLFHFDQPSPFNLFVNLSPSTCVRQFILVNLLIRFAGGNAVVCTFRMCSMAKNAHVMMGENLSTPASKSWSHMRVSKFCGGYESPIARKLWLYKLYIIYTPPGRSPPIPSQSNNGM